MRRFVTITFGVLTTTCVAYANPVIMGPTSFSFITIWVVIVFALMVEAGITALVLTFSGLSPVQAFVGFLVGNAAIYFLGFRPLLTLETIPLAALEVGVVAADAAVIKLLSALELFQGDHFTGLSWLRALTASGAGNAFSYGIGLVMATVH